MKKLSLVVKEASEKQVKNRLKDADGVFIVRYSKLSGPDMNALRLSLKDTRAKVFMLKNSVARRALKDSGLDTLVGSVEGACGFIFSKDEPVGTSKVLYAFAKEHEQFVLAAGLLKDKVLEKKDIEALAKLPSLEVLRGQVVCTLNAPIVKLVICLKQTLNKFVIVLDQIKTKKSS